jgi:hypothetical protein
MKFQTFFNCFPFGFRIIDLRLTLINSNNPRYWLLHTKYVFNQPLSKGVFYFFKIINTKFADVYLKIWYIFRPIFAIFRLYCIGNINHFLFKSTTTTATTTTNTTTTTTTATTTTTTVH